MTPRARIGEKVLYKTMKTVKLKDDTEKRWRYGIWLGVIENTSEHIIGTKEGVVKCRAVSQITDDRKFDREFSAEIRGTPWRPSPRHSTWTIRTNLEEDEDIEEEPEVNYEAKINCGEDVDAAIKIIEESKRIIESKVPTQHGLHISQSDIARYGATAGCKGCRYVLGRLPYQQAHSTECRKRIVGLMREDPEDRLRVQHWEQDRGIKEKKYDMWKEAQEENKGESKNFRKDNNEQAETSNDKMEDSENIRKGKKRTIEDDEEAEIVRLEKEFGVSRYHDLNQQTSSSSSSKDNNSKRKGVEEETLQSKRKNSNQ